MDFVAVKKILRELIERLDHRFINDVPPFDVLNPSAENMARYFFDEIAGALDAATPVRVGEVKIWETDVASATYRLSPE